MFNRADEIFFELLLNPILYGATLGIIFSAVYSLADKSRTYSVKFKKSIIDTFAYSTPVVLLGFISGYLTGISRSPAVGNVIPAILTLVGGFNIYVFGKELKHRAIIGYSVIVFSLLFFY